MLPSVPFAPRLSSRRLSMAVLAAWGMVACAQPVQQAADSALLAPPQLGAPPAVPPVATVAVPPASSESAAPAADPLGALLDAAADGAGASVPAPDSGASAPAPAPATDGAATAQAAPPDQPGQPLDQPAAPAAAGEPGQAQVDPSTGEAPAAEEPVELAGPPEPPPPPPVVLFPERVGVFVPDPPAPAPAQPGEASAETPPDAPPVFASSLPAMEPAEESVWRLSYSGRAAYEERRSSGRVCPGAGLSSGLGSGVACRSTGEVSVKESLLSLDGGGQVQVVAKARGTEATTVNGRPAAVDPYQLVPQFYTAVSGLSELDGATMWMGRRDVSPFLLSSGLLPPTSNAMRFGVDNARVGSVGLSYQFTARDETNGQHLPSYHSLRTGPIRTNDRGSLQLGFTRVESQDPSQDAGSAWWASALHEQKGVLAGTNRLGVQYGSGSRTAMTGYTGMGASLSRVRVAESMEWKGQSGLGGSVESSMQFDQSALGTLQWMATRVRPSYVASDQFKLTFEVAHDQISSGFGASGQRTALTVAPTFTLGKSAGNANLRAFYTYSRSNDVDGISFAAPAEAWASQASGSIFGIQLNRRW
ncbi:carbohydrate porin [Cupriavidus respiraculi]|uniref:carbohydrate porin n=1 Tax=Cupriavidus respiraculi TaxID=195930 RepID=UPI001C97D1E4|nr:carbohydrate porin [Cupriavidus respiraculi]MBY4946492.1 carbohydrate porin [Cupriavidus respiraculi]